jgi:hypothetical protein
VDGSGLEAAGMRQNAGCQSARLVQRVVGLSASQAGVASGQVALAHFRVAFLWVFSGSAAESAMVFE